MQGVKCYGRGNHGVLVKHAGVCVCVRARVSGEGAECKGGAMASWKRSLELSIDGGS